MAEGDLESDLEGDQAGAETPPSQGNDEGSTEEALRRRKLTAVPDKLKGLVDSLTASSSPMATSSLFSSQLFLPIHDAQSNNNSASPTKEDRILSGVRLGDKPGLIGYNKTPLTAVDPHASSKNLSSNTADRRDPLKKKTKIISKIGSLISGQSSLQSVITGRCWRCGEKGHKIDSCRNPRICFNCRRTGHIARFCTASSPSRHPMNTSSLRSNTSSLSSPTVLSLQHSAIGQMGRSVRSLNATPLSRAIEAELDGSIFFMGDNVALEEVIAAFERPAPPGCSLVRSLGYNRFQLIGSVS